MSLFLITIELQASLIFRCISKLYQYLIENSTKDTGEYFKWGVYNLFPSF